MQFYNKSGRSLLIVKRKKYEHEMLQRFILHKMRKTIIENKLLNTHGWADGSNPNKMTPPPTIAHHLRAVIEVPKHGQQSPSLLSGKQHNKPSRGEQEKATQCNICTNNEFEQRFPSKKIIHFMHFQKSFKINQKSFFGILTY